MSFNFADAEKVNDFKELLIPEMNYEVQIIGAEEKDRNGVNVIDFKFEILDTYPESGVEFDEEEVRDPYNQIMFKSIWFQLGSGKEAWKTRNLKAFHDAFGVELNGEVDADNYIDMVAIAQVKHFPVDKENPLGPKKPLLANFYPLPAKEA